MNQKKIVLSVLAAALMSPLMANATNGYFSHGYGIKAKGMGGVGIALPQDSLAAATNPAGMVMVGDRIDLGVDLFIPNRGSDISGNGAGLNGVYSANGKSNFLIPEFGYNKMLGSDMSVGVSVFGNGGMNTQYNQNPFTAFGGKGPAGINLEQLFIAPTWAIKINPQHAIGVSLNFVYQTFSATGLPPAFPSSAPTMMTDAGKDSSTGIGLRLGWTGEITPEFTMGATYQPKTKMSKFSKYSGLFAEAGGFDIPASYGVGFAYKLMPSTTMAFDIEKIDYSNVASVANMLTAPGTLLGNANGSGFGWQNMTVYKLGVSHVWNEAWTVRAGYNHNNAQIPASQTFFNTISPGVVQDHLTLGATWNVSKDNELSFSYMHAFKQSVNGMGSIPALMGGGNANINMYQDSLGVAYSWKL